MRDEFEDYFQGLIDGRERGSRFGGTHALLEQFGRYFQKLRARSSFFYGYGSHKGGHGQQQLRILDICNEVFLLDRLQDVPEAGQSGVR